MLMKLLDLLVFSGNQAKISQGRGFMMGLFHGFLNKTFINLTKKRLFMRVQTINKINHFFPKLLNPLVRKQLTKLWIFERFNISKGIVR
mgnify:CR=1 FL=1